MRCIATCKTLFRALRCIAWLACLHPIGLGKILRCVWHGKCQISWDVWNTMSPKEGRYHYRCYWHEGRVKCAYGYAVPIAWKWLPLYVVGKREVSQNGWLLGN
jgi:hypothetical protein